METMKCHENTKHVEHIQDFWGDPLTAGGSQSKDGKAALVQVYLAGNQGEALSNQSVDAIREIVASVPPPPFPLMARQGTAARRPARPERAGADAPDLFALLRRLSA